MRLTICSTSIPLLRRSVAWLVVGFLAGLTSCSPSGREARSFPVGGAAGDPPVWATVDHLSYGRLVFYPQPESDWKQLVDMKLFEGFRPGMTFRAARRELGEPNRRDDDSYRPSWDYERPRGTVRISHPLKGSVPFVRAWDLTGFPTTGKLEAVFHPNVSKHIPTEREDLTVVIMNGHGSPSAFMRVAMGQVTAIDWVKE